MSQTELSEYVPPAINCWVAPIVRLAGDAGVTAIDVSVTAGATTTRITTGLVIPEREAVIPVDPASIPVAKPEVETGAITMYELAQVTCDVMSATLPFEYVPTAMNCRV